MCDWTYAAYAVLAAGTANQAEQTRKSASQARTAQREAIDAAAGERAKAEAEAAQAANARIAVAQQRCRQQNNLMASGASTPNSAPTGESVLDASTPVANSNTPRQQQSLMSRGGAASFYG